MDRPAQVRRVSPPGGLLANGWRRVFLASALASSLGAGPASAQLVQGYVIDASTTERLVATSIVVTDTLGTPVGTGFSGADGAFALRLPRAGAYRLRAQRLGYQEFSASVDLRAESSVSLLLRLLPQPVALPSITVEARRTAARLQEVGFYDRKRMGFGYFFTPEMIQQRNPIYVTDLLKVHGGVRLLYRFGTPVDVVLRAGDLMFGGRSCAPAVMVDGVVVRSGGGGGLPLNDLVSASDLSAMEVYPDAVGMPVQVGGLDGSCGAIVLWTRRR